jgi:transcriptional regulator with XRE-family HTH domain
MGGLGSGRQPDVARRREVMRLHAEGMTFAEIGCRMGVTRQRVEQILRAVQRDGSRSLRCRECEAFAAPPGTAPNDSVDVLCLDCLGRRPEAPFAERLKSCRAAAGLRLIELARRSGITADTLRGYEAGVRFPRWPQLAALLRVLGPKLVTLGMGEAEALETCPA